MPIRAAAALQCARKSLVHQRSIRSPDFNQLQEWASPGYLERMQERAAKTYGQSYWWDPEQGLPSETPDLSKAVAH